MMERIFIAEYITGGGFAGAELPDSLVADGRLMRDAVVRDLAALAQYDLLVAQDARVAVPALPRVHPLAGGAGEVWQYWAEGIAQCDAVLIIAPETDGVLLRATQMIEQSGKVLLGSDSAAVRLTASKITTAHYLINHGIAMPDTIKLGAVLPAGKQGYVIKPDDGVGSDGVQFCTDAAAVTAQAPASGCVVQPFIAGMAGSLSLLAGASHVQLLAVNAQIQAGSNPLAQTGVIVNSAKMLHQLKQTGWDWPQLQQLAQRIVRAIPGLRGYIGVDFIATAQCPVVLEINPRLTSSYAGLQESLAMNPARLLLDACLCADFIDAVPTPQRKPVTLSLQP